MNNKLTIISVLLIFSPLAAVNFSLADSDNSNWSLALYLDNDCYYDTDKYYTNGLKLLLISPYLDQVDNDSFISKQMRHIDQSLGFLYAEESDHKQNFLFFLGQDIYTPEDKEQVVAVADDRPYAGWLYVGMGYNCRQDNKLDSLRFSLGIIGPDSLGEDVQGLFHDFNGDRRAAGWHNQLDNEIGLLLTYERKQKLLGSSRDSFGYDVIGHIGGSFGNVSICGNFGLEFRAGINLPTDLGTSSWQNSSPSTPSPVNSKGFSPVAVHFFAAMDGRVVARNIFLDGNTFIDSHAVERKIFVADFSIGLAITYQRYKISFTHTYRSKEFMEQADPHRFGTISFTLLF